MKSRGLLLLLGPLALWAELLAAPAKDPAGAAPLSQVSGPGASRPGQVPSEEEGTIRPSEVGKVLRTGPMPGGGREPQDPPGSRGADMAPSKEGLPGRAPLLPPGGAQPGLTEKPAQNKGPRPEGSPGGSASAEEAQVGPAGNHLLEKNPARGVGIVSGGEEAVPTVGSPGFATVAPLSNTGHPVYEDKKLASEVENKPAADILRGSRTSPASRETPGPCAGPSKSLCGGKPASAEKPPSGEKAHGAEASPAPDTKPPSGEKPAPNEKPTSGGEKPPPEHVAPGKPAPHDKPAGASEKPAAKEQPEEEEEEEEAGGDGDEGDSSDDADAEEEAEDEEEEEGDRHEEADSIFSADKDEGSKHFDDELDYGLNQSPFNSNEYHDWWGGGSEEELDTKPEEGDVGALSEEGDGDVHEEPVFDVWGDLVEKGDRPEA